MGMGANTGHAMDVLLLWAVGVTPGGGLWETVQNALKSYSPQKARWRGDLSPSFLSVIAGAAALFDASSLPLA